MPRVLVLTRYDHMGASSRVRFLQYIPHLEAQGFSFQIAPLFSNAHLARLYRENRRSMGDLITGLAKRIAVLLRASQADVIWLQQEVFPFLPAGMEKVLFGGRPVVIDFDDATQLYYQQHPSALARRFYGGKIARLMRHAAAVVVGSDTMAAVARDAGARNVHLVYSAVDCARFVVQPPPQARGGTFTVGWIGTPMTAAQSLHLLSAPLKTFLSETQSDCVLVGVDPGQFPDLPARRIPWSEAAEAETLPALSVGLCPLDDSLWTRGKSGYKILQYMAAGRPALTSPVGIAERLVEPGITGFHCRSADDWHGALTRLFRDAHLREALGRTARGRAEHLYDTRIAAAQLAGILTAAVPAS